MEVGSAITESEIEKLSLSELQQEHKPHPNRELSSVQQLERSYIEGCNIIPTGFFERQMDARAGSQIGVSYGMEVDLCSNMSDIGNGGGSSMWEGNDGGLSMWEDNDGGSSVCVDDNGSSVWEDDGDCCVGEDENNSDSYVAEDETSGSSIGTELALELALKKPPWVPRPPPTDDEKAVKALHIVRCLQFTEYDPKLHYAIPMRFCIFNIAFFDLEKESTAGLGQPLDTLTPSDCIPYENSVNVISVNILESDVGYPISIFGTILVRDQIDYKCVYLFRRCKDSPQVITSQKDMLTLMDPQRGLAVTSSLFFEINLKIKGDDGDQNFSKGVIEHCATNESHIKQMVTRRLPSWMSTLQLVYTAVPCALVATLALNILKGARDFFTGKVTAWTTGNQNRIVLYDSGAPGTVTALGDGGSIVFSRSLVAVPSFEELVLSIVVRDGGSNREFELVLGHDDEGESVWNLGSYEVLVKITWTCMAERHKVFENVGRTPCLV
ncbi:hypothetical protein BS78_04G067600 [Paspalum vaginatum]|nr:hypothetical protein BS78_04G067600 [Paspalum vaginatum]